MSGPGLRKFIAVLMWSSMVPVAVALGGRMSTKYKVEVANDGAVSPGQASEHAETELPSRRNGKCRAKKDSYRSGHS